MKPNAVNKTTTEQTTTHGEPLIGSNVLEDAQSLWHELRALIHDHFQLAALETRRAGESLVTMMIAGIIVALLLIGAWLGLVAAAVQILIEQGMVASNAILLAVAGNLLVALLLCSVIRYKSRSLQFPATVRSLQAMPPNHKNTESS
jgi:hypothetical protein